MNNLEQRVSELERLVLGLFDVRKRQDTASLIVEMERLLNVQRTEILNKLNSMIFELEELKRENQQLQILQKAIINAI